MTQHYTSFTFQRNDESNADVFFSIPLDEMYAMSRRRLNPHNHPLSTYNHQAPITGRGAVFAMPTSLSAPLLGKIQIESEFSSVTHHDTLRVSYSRYAVLVGPLDHLFRRTSHVSSNGDRFRAFSTNLSVRTASFIEIWI
jgi:hypothetical protein